MATTPETGRATLDLREQIARIDRVQAEPAKWQLGNLKARNETAKIAHDIRFAPWAIVTTAPGADAALFAAGAAFIKLMG